MVSKARYHLLSIFILLTSNIHPKIFFFDVSNTIMRIDQFAFARHLGISNIITSLATSLWQSPFENPVRHVQKRFLEALSQVPCSPAPAYTVYNDDGITPMPPLMHNYGIGLIDYTGIHTLWNEWVDHHPNFFSNRFERNVMNKLFESGLDPIDSVRFAYELPTVKLLTQCSQQTDAQGNKKNVCIILSNWSADAVQAFKKRFADSIVKYIDACIFSGEIHLAKPDHSFYKYVYDFVARNYPEQMDEQWFFFDDQLVNLKAAEKYMGHTVMCALPNEAEALLKQQHVIT